MTHTSTDIQESRYEYIDTLKGISIILIVCIHSFLISHIYSPSFTVIPLFFTLSGIFHNTSDSCISFLKKRIFQLIVPYISYNLIVCIGLYSLYFAGINLPYERNILTIFSTRYFYDLLNYPLWFLPALFSTQIIFMIIYKACRSLDYQWKITIIGAVSVMIGYVGYNIQPLPLFLDKGLLGLTFYSIGFLFSQTPFWKNPTKFNKTGYCLIVPSIVIYLLTRNNFDMANNIYDIPYPILIINITALFVGSLYICKLINKLPIITYFGRNSLIVLCTHVILIIPISIIYTKFIGENFQYLATTVIAIALLYRPIIPLCRRYLPYISGIKQHNTQQTYPDETK